MICAFIHTDAINLLDAGSADENMRSLSRPATFLISLAMVNRLTFNISSATGSAARLVPVIDGVSLSERVATFEAARGYDDPTGGYGGIVPEYMNYGPIDDYFLARGISACRQDDGAQYLLGCQCGEVGCWPLMGRITSQGDVYVWSGFFNPCRPQRDYSSFGPFLYERCAYTAAVADMAIGLAGHI